MNRGFKSKIAYWLDTYNKFKMAVLFFFSLKMEKEYTTFKLGLHPYT